MAKAGRLAGAILAQTGDDFYLVGNLKEPCDFAAAGFADPGEIDPLARPFIKLETTGSPEIATPYFEMNLEGEDLARALARTLVIKRNGSVSERLLNLIWDAEENDGKDIVDATWLGTMPAEIWDMVRDEVLRC